MKRLIIDQGIIFNRLAVMEDEKLSEFLIENKFDESLVGNIYLGRVSKVIKSMSAAFVDIGIEKNGYLQLNNELIKSGSQILVQVKKDPIKDKGATLSTELSLSGKYVVLIPESHQRNISRKISDKNKKKDLLNLVDSILDSDNGIVIRTEAANVEEILIKEEIISLQNKWNDIKVNRNRILKDRLIYEDYSFIDMISKEYSIDVDEIIINKKESLGDNTILYKDDYPIFEYFKIESQILESLQREVVLHQGSYITIDETEAMTIVDVNSGKFIGSNNKEETFLQVNLAAAKEIARQIRLRNVSGIIIIDFINMKDKNNYNLLLDNMKKHFRKDKGQPKIHGVTTLGLVEVTRKKNRKSMSSILFNECNTCNGSGYIPSDEIVISRLSNKIELHLNQSQKDKIVVESSKNIFEILNKNIKNISYKEYIENELKISIELKINTEFNEFKYELRGYK